MAEQAATTTDRDAARRNTRARFEQWAQNPACEANTVSAVHNIKMAEVAKAEGYDPTMGQSPFAIARGESFERGLFYNNAERMLDALREAAVLPPDVTGFVDLRTRMNGGPQPSLDTAIEESRSVLRRIVSDVDPPSVIAGATVRIPRGIMLPEAILILDVLAIRTGEGLPQLIVGEIKTYPDRGGHTDSGELALARAQAGLYLHAIRIVVEELGIQDSLRVRDDGFLILSRPGSNWPSVRAGEDLRYQAERARRGFELLESAAQGLPPFDHITDNPIESVQKAGTEFSEACLSFCDRADKCYEESLTEGDPRVLGDEVPRFLGEVKLGRALDLMDGDPPRNATESDLVNRIAQAEGIPLP